MSLAGPSIVRAGAGLVLSATVLLLTGCLPEPLPTATTTTSPTPSASASTPTPTPTDDASGGSLTIPATCEEVYTPEMLAMLQAEVSPLNDPGITMLSTQNVEALEILSSGAPTLRCTWGPPSERGIATNVTIVSGAEAETVAAALAAAGFSSRSFEGGTLYEQQQEMVDQADNVVTMGEIHFLRGEGWVSTRWIDVHPDGYTEAIVAALWD